MDVVCLNGEFVELDEAHIALTDAGFLVGDGVFETLRVEQGQVLYAADHFARLGRGLRVLEIPYNLEPDELLALCQQVVDANELDAARLRITVTRGESRGVPMSTGEGEPTLVITATALETRDEHVRARGWRLVLVPVVRNERSPLATVKSTSYAENLLARRAARRLGFDEALLLNTRGLVAEAAMGNIFAFRGDALVTPPVADGALPGTMRARLLRLGDRFGLDIREQSLNVEDLLAADEVFLTNAIVQVLPVVQLGERPIGNGEPGTRTRSLYQSWRHEVEQFLEESRLT